MAREYGPHGIHVAHVVIDGGIAGERLLSHSPRLLEERGEDGLLGIDAIAEAYWQIHRQPRSAWTHEIDHAPSRKAFERTEAHHAVITIRHSRPAGSHRDRHVRR